MSFELEHVEYVQSTGYPGYVLMSIPYRYVGIVDRNYSRILGHSPYFVLFDSQCYRWYGHMLIGTSELSFVARFGMVRHNQDDRSFCKLMSGDHLWCNSETGTLVRADSMEIACVKLVIPDEFLQLIGFSLSEKHYGVDEWDVPEDLTEIVCTALHIGNING